MADQRYEREKNDWTLADKLADRIARTFSSITEKLGSILTTAKDFAGGKPSNVNNKNATFSGQGSPQNQNLASAFTQLSSWLQQNQQQSKFGPQQNQQQQSQTQQNMTGATTPQPVPPPPPVPTPQPAPLPGQPPQQIPHQTLMGMPVYARGQGVTTTPPSIPPKPWEVPPEVKPQGNWLDKIGRFMGTSSPKSKEMAAINARQGEIQKGASAGEDLAFNELDKQNAQRKRRGAVSGSLDIMAGSRTGSEPAAAFKGLGQLSKGIPGLDKVVEPVAKFGEVLFGTIDKIKAWGDKLHQADMQFAQFSASMAKVMAEKEIRDLGLNMQRGETRARAAQYREESASRRDNALAPTVDLFSNATSLIVGALNDGIAALMTPINNIYKLLGIKLPNPDGAVQPMGDWITRNVARASEFERVGRPDRFPRE